MITPNHELGSFAKNSENENSDIDIAVKLSSEFKTLSNYINAKNELSELLDGEDCHRPLKLLLLIVQASVTKEFSPQGTIE